MSTTPATAPDSYPAAPFALFAEGDPQAKGRWSFIYFHELDPVIRRQQERNGWEMTAPDLVGADRPWNDTMAGVWDLDIYGVPSRAFLWLVGVRARGLIVRRTNTDAMAYAARSFATKRDFL